MKRIEDIKEFEDIDTYYGISEIVDEVFQDRVEVHKRLVTAYKEIKRLKNIIKEVREYIEEKEKDDDNWIDYELCIEPIVIKKILDKAGDEK